MSFTNGDLKNVSDLYDYMDRHHYPQHCVTGQIDAAIHLLCEELGTCTPTDVIELCGYQASKELRGIVIDRARFYEYMIVPRSKGFVIHDWFEMKTNE